MLSDKSTGGEVVGRRYVNYNQVFSMGPEPIREATVVQLSIGAHYKATWENPFWDPDLLTPFTDRLVKKVKLRCLSLRMGNSYRLN